MNDPCEPPSKVTLPSLEEIEYIAGSPKPLMIKLPEFKAEPAHCELGLKVTAPIALKDIIKISPFGIEIDGKIKPEKDEIFTFKVGALTPTGVDDIDASEWAFDLSLKFPKKANQAEQVIVAGLAATVGLVAASPLLLGTPAMGSLASSATTAIGNIAGSTANIEPSSTGGESSQGGRNSFDVDSNTASSDVDSGNASPETEVTGVDTSFVTANDFDGLSTI